MKHLYENFNNPLVIACPVMKNNDNISMIARSASCFGVKTLIITGQNRINNHISRDCDITIENHHTLIPAIKRYRIEGYKIIGLEQSENSIPLNYFKFDNLPTLLVVGNECKGTDPEVMKLFDQVIEIPLVGEPYSLNVAMATSIVLFECVKQMVGDVRTFS